MEPQQSSPTFPEGFTPITPTDLPAELFEVPTMRLETIDDSDASIVLCFAGRGGDYEKGGGWGPFQFANTFRGMDVNILYLRDPAEGWFQRGLVGLGDTVEDMATALQAFLRPYAGRPIITMGYSMGGYAAIMFGLLLGARKAIALAPQSFIDPTMRAEHGDTRWDESLRQIRPERMQYPDLIPLMKTNRGTHISIFYAQGNAFDALHAERIAPLPYVTSYAVPGEDHNVARALKRLGLLRTVIEQEINNQPLPPPFTDDNSPTWRLDELPGSKKAIVVVGSRGRGFGAFEFSNTFRSLPCHVLYIRDPQDAWYQKPIRELGNGLNDLAAIIREKLQHVGAEEIYIIGGSMGGYAAIALGGLLHAHRVLAFAPQSFISPELRAQHKDDRWSENLSPLGTNIQHGDLLPLLQEAAGQNPKGKVVIHYSKDVLLDKLHAERLSVVPQVQLHGHPSPRHNIARVMQKRGQFYRAIAEAFDLPADIWN